MGRGDTYIRRTNRRPNGVRRRPAPPCPFFLAPILVAATCGPIPQPLPEHDGAGALDPPSSYAAMWYEMESCSGKRGSFRAVRWYVVPTEHWAGFKCKPNPGCVGQYFYVPHAIYLADFKVASKETVKHEILHALGMKHDDPEFWRCLDQPMPDRFKPENRGRP